jgi:hypothetical protein
MEEATEYKKYLKGLERIEAKDQLDKATKKVKAMEAAKAPVKNVFEKAIGVFPKVSKRRFCKKKNGASWKRCFRLRNQSS